MFRVSLLIAAVVAMTALSSCATVPPTGQTRPARTETLTLEFPPVEYAP